MAADKRKVEMQEYDESEQKKKDDIKMKKANLKKVQEQDAQAKQQYKDRLSQMAKRVEDFKDNNILSYVYQAKQNKSFEYDQKKEANITKIIQAFPVQDKREQYTRTLG